VGGAFGGLQRGALTGLLEQAEQLFRKIRGRKRVTLDARHLVGAFEDKTLRVALRDLERNADASRVQHDDGEINDQVIANTRRRPEGALELGAGEDDREAQVDALIRQAEGGEEILLGLIEIPQKVAVPHDLRRVSVSPLDADECSRDGHGGSLQHRGSGFWVLGSRCYRRFRVLGAGWQ